MCVGGIGPGVSLSANPLGNSATDPGIGPMAARFYSKKVSPSTSKKERFSSHKALCAIRSRSRCSAALGGRGWGIRVIGAHCPARGRGLYCRDIEYIASVGGGPAAGLRLRPFEPELDRASVGKRMSYESRTHRWPIWASGFFVRPRRNFPQTRNEGADSCEFYCRRLACWPVY